MYPRPVPVIAIRLATANDALCLGALGTQVWLDTYAVAGIRPAMAEEVRRSFSMGSLQTQMARPDTRVLLAEFNDHLVGFAQLRFDVEQAYVHSERPCELERLYVQRPFQGQRVGAQLLHEAEELAAQGGATAIWAAAWIHNMRALRFYERRGYSRLGSSWFELDRERHENWVLSKPL